MLEIDKDLKKKLYSILAMESITLKEWFIAKALEKISLNESKVEKTE